MIDDLEPGQTTVYGWRTSKGQRPPTRNERVTDCRIIPRTVPPRHDPGDGLSGPPPCPS
jgi:hypothetical protein